MTLIFALFFYFLFALFLLATLFSMSFLFFGLDHFLLSYTCDNYEVIVKIRYFAKKGCNYIFKMLVNLEQWRIEIGYFSNYSRKHLRPSILPNIGLLYARYYIYIILLCGCGDVKLDPGPKPNSSKCFCICHWKLNVIIRILL